MGQTSDEILLPGKIRKCLLEQFPEYEYKKRSGFQLRTFKSKTGEVSVRVIYRISGASEKRLKAVEKRNAKIQNLKDFSEHLMAHGYVLSPDFKSNGKASYFKRNPALLKSRLQTFEGLQQYSLLAADGQDEENLENLYLVSSFWHGEQRPEFRLRSMRYGIELQDTYTPVETANYGYKVIGVLSDSMVDKMFKWWSAGAGKKELKTSEIFRWAKKLYTYRQWKRMRSSGLSKKTYQQWRKGKKNNEKRTSICL